MKSYLSIALITFPVSFAALAGSAPSGAHFNLNIIGVPKAKTAEMSGNEGNRIFVPISSIAKIGLVEGSEFQVLDSNATDGEAKFQLPNSGNEDDGVTAYSVYARAVGKPGGSASVATCAVDPLSMEEVCSLQSLIMVRKNGSSKMPNVSAELLFIYADLDNDGTAERLNLFDDRLQDYLWSYDNRGLKILQLRFYQITTDLNQ